MNRQRTSSRFAQSGLTLVELMVAMLIALILLAGLVTVFASMRTSFATTKALNTLVNQQRFASTVLTNAINTAGYYPLTVRSVRGSYPNAQVAFPVESTSIGGQSLVFDTAGQVVYGTGATSATADDVVAVRMVHGGGAVSPFDCLGQAPASATGTPPVRTTSVFWVDPNTNELKCATSSNPTGSTLVGGEQLKGPGIASSPALYGGVESLSIEYGVDTDRDGSVDRYMSADTLNSGAGKICPDVTTGAGNSSSCWPYVRSVSFTLGFINALNQGKKALSLTRTVMLNNSDAQTRAPNLDL